jgi:ABC-type protease/lipase transport system fused ATPase/permease subunit
MTGAPVGGSAERAGGGADALGRGAGIRDSLGRHLRGPLSWTVGLSVVMNVLVLAPSIFMLQVFDRVLVSRSMDTLLVLLAGTAIALLLLFALDYVRTRLQGLLGQMIGDALVPAAASGLIEGASRRAAGASTALRDGYETVVDTNSALVSSGQRQRIALGEALKALRGEVTVIAVTHRTNLVQHMDRLLVLDAGRTKLEGPVAEVMAALSGASRSVAHIAPVPRNDRLGGVAR